MIFQARQKVRTKAQTCGSTNGLVGVVWATNYTMKLGEGFKGTITVRWPDGGPPRDYSPDELELVP